MLGRILKKWGLGACPTSELTFVDLQGSEGKHSRKLNEGSSLLTNALEWERDFMSFPLRGCNARRIMEKCIEYMSIKESSLVNQLRGISGHFT